MHGQYIVLHAAYLYQTIDVSIRLFCACKVLHFPCLTHYGVVGTLLGLKCVKTRPRKKVTVFASPPLLHCHTIALWYQQVVQATFVLRHYTSKKKKYLVQGDIHKCKR